jgi:geranylgeranyl reductase family protein
VPGLIDAERMYDVAIVGAGPAGSAAALAAVRAGARVLLLDRHDFPRDKTCGDGIAPQALAVLAGLGVPDVADGYAQVPALRLTGPSGASAARRLPVAAHVIPRAVFDARLVAAAVAAGATLRRHTVRRVTVRAASVLLDDEIEARVVIGADGASSLVRKELGIAPNPPGHLAIAIRGYAPMPASTDPAAPLEQQIVMTEQHWPAYAWSFPIGDGRRNVGYGELLQGPPVSRAHLLGRLTELFVDVDLAATTGLRAHHLPLSTRRPIAGRGRLLLAGDALSLINPFTGEGIFYAVLSGAIAGAAAAGEDGALAGQRYASALRRRLHRHLRHTSAIARLSALSFVVDAGIRAAARRQRVFDGFVELGLGDGLLTPTLLASVLSELPRRP